MRIISQDRCCDVGYENCILQIEELTGFCQISAVVDKRWYGLGLYNDKKSAMAVLWDIAHSYKGNEIYYEMPKRNADWFIYPRESEENG